MKVSNPQSQIPNVNINKSQHNNHEYRHEDACDRLHIEFAGGKVGGPGEEVEARFRLALQLLVAVHRGKELRMRHRLRRPPLHIFLRRLTRYTTVESGVIGNSKLDFSIFIS